MGDAVKNTLWIIGVMVPLQVIFAFGVGLMLARARRGGGFFRTIFYLPALAPPVAATLAFVYILNPATGPVNILLKHIGIEGPLWFQSPGWSKPSLVMLGLWGVGNIMIIFRRHPRRRSTCTSRRSWMEQGRCNGCAGDAADDQPVILFSVAIGVTPPRPRKSRRR